MICRLVGLRPHPLEVPALRGSLRFRFCPGLTPWAIVFRRFAAQLIARGLEIGDFLGVDILKWPEEAEMRALWLSRSEKGFRNSPETC
jgi:hypothetical protein